MKKIVLIILVGFLFGALMLTGCGTKNKRPLDAKKITYVCYIGDQPVINMFVITPDYNMKQYIITYDNYAPWDLFAGELPDKNEYKVTERQISENDWNSIVSVLTDVDFMELKEDLTYSGACDASSDFIQVETVDGVHKSGGYAVRYDEGKDNKRFKKIMDVIEPIVWKQ